MVSPGTAIIEGWRQLPQELPAAAEELTCHVPEGQSRVAVFLRPPRLRESPLPLPTPVTVQSYAAHTAPSTSAGLELLASALPLSLTASLVAGNPAKYSRRI